MNSEYLIELRKLSISARSAVALLICERYIQANKFENLYTEEFFEHLWGWPLVTDFDLWEKDRPFLVDYGLGESASEVLWERIRDAGLNERMFRQMIEGAVEILWGSFWGAAEDEQSFESLGACIRSSGLTEFPVLTPFKFSTFCEGNGWGSPISEQDRDFWRFNSKFV